MGRAGSLVRGATRPRSRADGLHRRDRGRDQHGAPLWPGTTRGTLPLRGAARTLQDDDRHRRLAGERPVCDRAHGRCPRRASASGPTWPTRSCRRFNPGETVVMDNLAAHKVNGVRELIEAAGARLLYLPAYSPDFNPIEMAFAKIKALLAHGCGANRSRSVGGHTHGLHPLHAHRVPKLSRSRRLRRL